MVEWAVGSREWGVGRDIGGAELGVDSTVPRKPRPVVAPSDVADVLSVRPIKSLSPWLAWD